MLAFDVACLGEDCNPHSNAARGVVGTFPLADGPGFADVNACVAKLWEGICPWFVALAGGSETLFFSSDADVDEDWLVGAVEALGLCLADLVLAAGFGRAACDSFVLRALVTLPTGDFGVTGSAC